MVLIKTEVPVEDLPAEHPARTGKYPTNPAGLNLPHPALAPHARQEHYETQFKCDNYKQPKPPSYNQEYDYQGQLAALAKFDGFAETGSVPEIAPYNGVVGYGAQLRQLAKQNEIRLSDAQEKQDAINNVVYKQASHPQWNCQAAKEEVIAHVGITDSDLEPGNEEQLWMKVKGQSESCLSNEHAKRGLIMGLEERHEARIAKAIPEGRENPDARNGPADYQAQLMEFERQIKAGLAAARGEGIGGQSITSTRDQNYQMQLLLLEQQNKKRLMAARGESVPEDQCAPPIPGESIIWTPSVGSPVTLQHMSPNMEQQNPPLTTNAHLMQLQQKQQIMAAHRHQQEIALQRQLQQQHIQQQRQMASNQWYQQSRNIAAYYNPSTIPTPAQNPPSQPPAGGFPAYTPIKPETNIHGLQNYQTQLNLLQSYCPNKGGDAAPSPSPTAQTGKFGNHTLQDYQMQLKLLEQQNKKREILGEADKKVKEEGGRDHTLQDYQMQLMLLEQQNKKREILGEADKKVKEEGGGNHRLQDYQMQLMLLEQQNKARLMAARAEMDRDEVLMDCPSDEHVTKTEPQDGPVLPVTPGTGCPPGATGPALVIRGGPPADDLPLV